MRLTKITIKLIIVFENQGWWRFGGGFCLQLSIVLNINQHQNIYRNQSGIDIGLYRFNYIRIFRCVCSHQYRQGFQRFYLWNPFSFAHNLHTNNTIGSKIGIKLRSWGLSINVFQSE